jgi:hypothetical protein
MVEHSKHRAPAACEKYWAAVKTGTVFPAVMKHNFEILKEDHGIT